MDIYKITFSVSIRFGIKTAGFDVALHSMDDDVGDTQQYLPESILI
jgi:hypothetical protein